jgi:hypothetical protein
MATFDRSNLTTLRQAYIDWTHGLEVYEVELDRAGLEILNDNWLSLSDKEMARVDSAREQIFNSLSKRAVADLKKMEREIARKVDKHLNQDYRYKVLIDDIESDKSRIQKGKRALKVMNERSWGEMGNDLLNSVKNLFKSEPFKELSEPFKELSDEHKLFQQSVLTLEVGLQKKVDQAENLKKLAVADEHSRFMKERLIAAKESSQHLTQEVVDGLQELGDMIATLNTAIKSARSTIRKNIESVESSVSALSDHVMEYTERVHQLVEKYESMTVENIYEQGSPEFILMVTESLKSLPRLQPSRSLVSRCGGQRKSDYRRMVYDQGSDAYDEGYGSDEEEANNVGRTYPFEPEVYQDAVAKMSDPAWGMNLLMYWGPGSGKTCAILLGLQKAAHYYLHHQPVDLNGEAVEAGALVLMQNNAGLEEYFGEINRFCINRKDMKGLRLVEKKRPKFDLPSPADTASHKPRVSTHSKSSNLLQNSPYKNSHEWCFVAKGTGRVVLRVIVHKMSAALLVASDWRKGPVDRAQRPPDGISHWELPRVGCVIIDEAHNLFDTSQMKTSQHSNHTGKFIAQMKARPDIRRLLSTGTPVADSDSFSKLETLLNFLRHPSPPGAKVLADTPVCSQKAAARDPDMTSKMVDLDALESGASKSSQKVPGFTKKLKDEREARSRWFYQKRDGDYAWRPCAEHVFKQMMYGYVSYVNMEADVTAFPQFGVIWGGRSFPKGTVHAKFVISGSQPTQTPKGSKSRKSKKAPALPANPQFEFTDFVSTNKGMSLMVVDVPSHAENIKAEDTRVTVQGQIGKHFTRIKDAVPYKWYALRQALILNYDVKHFVFLEKQTDDLLRKFSTWFSESNAADKTFAQGHPLKNPELFVLPRGYSDTWGDSRIEDHLKGLNRGVKRVYRYMILGDETTIKASLRFFNAACNKGGDYINIVMGLSTVKEQVTISDTNFVHLLQAPTSATLMNQVIRRVARRCSMSNIHPVDKWMVTVVIYHTPDSGKESGWLTKSLGMANTPVELAYRALQSTAVDCALYSAMTGVKCDAHEVPIKNTYCMYPRGGAQKLIKMVAGEDGTIYSEPDCINDEGLPGALLEYDVWDEILYQLLNNSGRYNPPRAIRAEDAPDLIRKFPETVQSSLRSGIWVEEGQKPKLTFARDVRPEVLARWIDATPDVVGRSVLHLLKNKRGGANQAVVRNLEKKARVYVQRVEIDVALHDSLEKKTKALQSIRDDFTFNLNNLKSASLMVDYAGKKVKKLVDRNARYT